MKITKEFKVGLLAVVSGALLYLGFNFLKGIDAFSRENDYYVIYDKIDGLVVSNPVLVNGYSVGRVHKITLLKEDQNKLLITLRVKNDIELTDSCRALLSSTGLMGPKAIELRINPSARILQDGDTLRGFIQQSLTEDFKEAASPVINKMVELMDSIQTSITGDLLVSLTSTVKNTEESAIQLNLILTQNQAHIHALLKNLSAFSSNMNKYSSELEPTLVNLKSFSDTLAAMKLKKIANDVDALILDLNTISKSISNGEGTLGKLIKDETLYIKMNSTVQRFDSTLIHFKKHPKHYLSPLGKKDIKDWAKD